MSPPRLHPADMTFGYLVKMWYNSTSMNAKNWAFPILTTERRKKAPKDRPRCSPADMKFATLISYYRDSQKNAFNWVFPINTEPFNVGNCWQDDKARMIANARAKGLI